jgi:hypothetical protein
MTNFYLALDGDNIGSRIELHVLQENIEGLRAFTESFNSVTNAIINRLRENPDINILLFGGDSLLLAMPAGQIEAVIELITEVTTGTTFTFSGGYGPTMRHAYLALKIAKASGKNRICPLTSEIPA